MGRSRALYIVLALFFGSCGIHNFYAGYWLRGILQLIIWLVISLISFGWLSWISYIWIIPEIFIIKENNRGEPLV